MTTQWFQSISMQAAMDLSGSQNLLVDVSTGTSTFECVLARFGAGRYILHNHPASGFAATVITEGFPFVRAGSALQAGQLFTANSDGFAIPTSMAPASYPGNVLRVTGTALQSVSSGQLFLAHLERFVVVNSAGMSMPNSFGIS